MMEGNVAIWAQSSKIPDALPHYHTTFVQRPGAWPTVTNAEELWLLWFKGDALAHPCWSAIASSSTSKKVLSKAFGLGSVCSSELLMIMDRCGCMQNLCDTFSFRMLRTKRLATFDKCKVQLPLFGYVIIRCVTSEAILVVVWPWLLEIFDNFRRKWWEPPEKMVCPSL